jgi:hypothetical protein
MTYDIYHFKASVLKPRAIGLVGAFFSFSKLKCTIRKSNNKNLCVFNANGKANWKRKDRDKTTVWFVDPTEDQRVSILRNES